MVCWFDVSYASTCIFTAASPVWASHHFSLTLALYQLFPNFHAGLWALCVGVAWGLTLVLVYIPSTEVTALWAWGAEKGSTFAIYAASSTLLVALSILLAAWFLKLLRFFNHRDTRHQWRWPYFTVLVAIAVTILFQWLWLSFTTPAPGGVTASTAMTDAGVFLVLLLGECRWGMIRNHAAHGRAIARERTRDTLPLLSRV